MKRLVALLALTALPMHGQFLALGNSGGRGTNAGGAPTFTPTGGTYAPGQTVTIACASGTPFYTLDGSQPTIASTEYTGAITLSATTTINALCAAPVVAAQNINTASTDWKICTPNGGGTPTSQACGGVGSIQPSAWDYTFGSTMNETVSTTSSTGTTQILFIYSGANGDAATYIAQHKVIQATVGNTYILNNELDMYQFCPTCVVSGAANGIEHMFGLQCNQQSGTLQWQIDNTGNWVNTGITQGCPLSTTATTTIDYQGHWIAGDTGCGGLGCNYYDKLCINGTCHTLTNVLEAAALPAGYAAVCGLQDQIDLTNTTTSGANPTTGGRSITNENVTCGNSAGSAVTSATYTIT